MVEQVSNFSGLGSEVFGQRPDPRSGNGPARWGQKGKLEEIAKNSKVIEVYLKKPFPLAMVMFMLFQIYEIIHIMMSWR